MTAGFPKLLAAVGALQLLCSAFAKEAALPACLLNSETPSSSSTCPIIIPEYSPPLNDAVRRSLRDLEATGKRVTIYEDVLAWNGDPAPTVLKAAPYNLVFNRDYFKRPTSALANLSIADTEVAWLTSGSSGCVLNTNTRANIGKMRDFVAAGGVLIADLATNCATIPVAPLAGTAVLDFGLLNSTLNDRGPSTIPDLPALNSLATTPNNLANLTGGSLSHGDLTESLLPLDAVVHLRGAAGRPIMASYSIGSGAVVVDIITKELPWFTNHKPGWTSDVMVAANLVYFAMDHEAGPPEVTLPADVLALEAESSDGSVYAFTPISRFAVTCEPVSGSVFELGLTTVTCSATNRLGTTTKSFTVTVVDTAPVIIAPSAITLQQGNTAGGATVAYSVTASDAVDGVTAVACDKPSGTFLFPLGISTVTCTSIDSGDREATATFTVEVIDTNGPAVCMTATAPLEQEGNTAGGAVFTYTVTAEDVVEGVIATVTCDHESGSVFPVGITTVSCSSKDSGDHETVATNDVVVTDTTGPVITVPSVVIQEATATSGATVTYTVSASDVVEGSTIVTCIKPSDTFMFPLGNNTVTCTSVDSGDIETTAVFYVVVADTTAPVVTMVNTSSLTLEFNSTAGGAVFDYTVSAVDTVDGAITAMACNQASGSVLPVGNNTVTCSASDSSNNAASASLNILVTPTPTPAPIAAVPQSAKSDVYVPNAWQGCLIAAASALLLCGLPIALRSRRKENNDVPPSADLAEVIPQGV